MEARDEGVGDNLWPCQRRWCEDNELQAGVGVGVCVRVLQWNPVIHETFAVIRPLLQTRCVFRSAMRWGWLGLMGKSKKRHPVSQIVGLHHYWYKLTDTVNTVLQIKSIIYCLHTFSSDSSQRRKVPFLAAHNMVFYSRGRLFLDQRTEQNRTEQIPHGPPSKHTHIYGNPSGTMMRNVV